jgi:hypothetical protein
MNVIDSHNLERDAGGKPVPTFPHPALAFLTIAPYKSEKSHDLMGCERCRPAVSDSGDFCYSIKSRIWTRKRAGEQER